MSDMFDTCCCGRWSASPSLWRLDPRWLVCRQQSPVTYSFSTNPDRIVDNPDPSRLRFALIMPIPFVRWWKNLFDWHYPDLEQSVPSEVFNISFRGHHQKSSEARLQTVFAIKHVLQFQKYERNPIDLLLLLNYCWIWIHRSELDWLAHVIQVELSICSIKRHFNPRMYSSRWTHARTFCHQSINIWIVVRLDDNSTLTRGFFR